MVGKLLDNIMVVYVFTFVYRYEYIYMMIMMRILHSLAHQQWAPGWHFVTTSRLPIDPNVIIYLFQFFEHQKSWVWNDSSLYFLFSILISQDFHIQTVYDERLMYPIPHLTRLQIAFLRTARSAILADESLEPPKKGTWMAWHWRRLMRIWLDDIGCNQILGFGLPFSLLDRTKKNMKLLRWVLGVKVEPGNKPGAKRLWSWSLSWDFKVTAVSLTLRSRSWHSFFQMHFKASILCSLFEVIFRWPSE